MSTRWLGAMWSLGRALAVLLGAVGIACSKPSPAPSPSISGPAVYEAVISNAYSRARPDTVLLDDSTVVFHPPEASALPAWRREYESFPSELVASLVEQSSVRKPVSKLPLPPATRIIPSRELRALFSKGGGGWQEFYRRYPAQRSWIELSPIAFSRDGTEAVVYREVHCGDLCGSGDLLWLERAEAGWRVRKSINFWIS